MLERNPKANTFVKPFGYTDLGWQLNPDNQSLIKCRESKHQLREFDNSTFRYRCTDVITICDECKTVYHTDMSD